LLLFFFFFFVWNELLSFLSLFCAALARVLQSEKKCANEEISFGKARRRVGLYTLNMKKAQNLFEEKTLLRALSSEL